MAVTTTGNYSPNRRKGGRGKGATNRAPGGAKGVQRLGTSGNILKK